MEATMERADLNRLIGAQIYKERVIRKLSQEALAATAGVSRNFISRLENGNNTAKIDTYYRIACALDTPLSKLFCAEHSSSTQEELQYLLSDCSAKEVHALIEILRTSKSQLALFR